MAWLRGLKTTYYLRALSATSTEKSTLDRSTLNAVTAEQNNPEVAAAATDTQVINESLNLQTSSAAPVPLACSIDDPDCEACQ